MHITSDSMQANLLYSTPFHYTDKNNTFDLVLYPVTMENILEFSILKQSILVRKNSYFPVKKVIKMSYLEFLFFTYNNVEFAAQYSMPFLPAYYIFAFELLRLVFKDQEVEVRSDKGGFRINGVEINDAQFDDLRRIIILQNGIDFDIDEFNNLTHNFNLNEKLNCLRMTKNLDKIIKDNHDKNLNTYFQKEQEEIGSIVQSNKSIISMEIRYNFSPLREKI